MSNFNYSFELHELDEALTPYGTIETRPPALATITTDDFTDGEHFRTGPDSNGALQLELEDRLLTLILDESGSMTWNDNNGDRYDYYKRMLKKLNATYPGAINANLIGFGGVPTRTDLFLANSGVDLISDPTQSFERLLQNTFQDSVYDFAGVRVVRRADRFPTHPADGIVVAEGIIEAAKDEDLTEGQQYYYGIWTFNKDLHFSRGQFVRGTPTDRILPKGVNLAEAFPRILPGAERDANSQLIYSFTEGTGFLVFDSSGQGRHATVGAEVIEDNFWSGDAGTSSYDDSGVLKKPVGVRFDGEFDVIDATIEDDALLKTSATNTDLVVNFWVFRYANTQDQWIIGTSTEEISNSIGWAIGITSDGYVGATSGVADTLQRISASIIPEKVWTMITVTMSNDSGSVAWDAYVNGASDTTATVSTAVPVTADKIYIGGKPEFSGAVWPGTDYFGSLNQVSIYNRAFNVNDVSALYAREIGIFNQPATANAQNPPDNGQREVLISWSVSDDFDFEGGQIKIIRKYNEIPSHAEDGTTVLTQTAEAGQFFFMDSFDFINQSDYYYRIFTINSLGNVCDRDEARILPVSIPRSINAPASPALSQVSAATVTGGNRKLLLQWSNPSDTRWRGTKIFFGLEGFPSISFDASGTLQVTDGVLIADTTNATFAHRIVETSSSGSEEPLTNGVTHFYAIVTYDRLGRVSEPTYLTGTPSAQLDTVFPPDEISDLRLEILNPATLSVQWNNPTIKTEQLDLFFGETSLVFVNVKDIFGGDLEDVTNLRLQVCTEFEVRDLVTSEQALGADGESTSGSDTNIGGRRGVRRVDGAGFGATFEEDCNTPEEEEETVLSYATVGSGLIKGALGHTLDPLILARRKKYTMDVRAQYKVVDPDDTSENPDSLFEFNTKALRVVFTPPLVISIVNQLNKRICIGQERDGGFRGNLSPCDCPPEVPINTCKTVNGGYAGSTVPYVARVELQYRGSALPDGTPVRVQLFKHGNDDPNPLADKSDRTFIREGFYTTSAVQIEEQDEDGNLTGRLVSKSIVDVEIQHPTLNDYVDLYVSIEYLGFVIDAVHEVRFIETLFIEAEVTPPASDGIDVAEQFATAWIINPDDPDDEDSRLPVPDGTLIKWELLKLLYAKERPFYSTQQLPQALSGVYSLTINGVARNVFFGPVGNIEAHHSTKTCGNDTLPSPCCVGEQYAIKASVILGSESATDAYKFDYPCPDTQEFTNRRFLMNADESQPLAGGPQSNPHWITWGDGIHMLKFQIAQNPAINTEVTGANCYRQCVGSISGQLLPFPDDHIVQITAAGEILWNVVFDEDPYTGELTPVSFDSISPSIAENLGIPFVANIPITGETTDFYVRYNTFVDEANPQPQDCESGGGSGGGGGTSGILPCEWRGVCLDTLGCAPTAGIKWDNVAVVRGVSTLISENKQVTLRGGGDYDEGIPPIFLGFREPLNVQVIDARINGGRVDELVVDGSSQHTFTVEVTFAGDPVPDGTPIELNVTGSGQNVVTISSCINTPDGCQPGSSGTIYTRQVNDAIINPQNLEETVAKRSLAYFSIDPLPDVVFNAKINVTCRYDKLGTVEREITKCIEVNNTVNVDAPASIPSEDRTIEESASSNEAIVYDTVKDLYQTTRASLQRRIGHFTSGVTTASEDEIYIFGGITGNGDSSTQNLTPRSEKFNVVTQEWEFTTDMQTPRAYGATVTTGGKIYLIGGVEIDSLLNQYVVSRKIEMFDVATELWNTTLSPMPEDYGVAFGNAEVVGNYIYVTSGVNSLLNSAQPDKLNDKIVRYSIADDEWKLITPSDELLYQRVAPFNFYRSAPQNRTYSEIELAAAEDDGYVINNVCTDGITLFMGRSGSQTAEGYFKYAINIPANSTIVSATLTGKLLSTFAGTEILDNSIWLVNIADRSGDICDAGDPIQDYGVTSSSVSWTLENSTPGFKVSSNIAGLIQEFVNRSDYVSGNNIALRITPESSVANGGHTWQNANNDPKEAFILNITYISSDLETIYTYGGSIPKPIEQIEAERTRQVNRSLAEFRSFILTSNYFNNLPQDEQDEFIRLRELEIVNSTVVPAFIYPATGYKFIPGSETTVDGELEMDISDTVDDEWPVLPQPRDHGRAVYIPLQDTVYFIGGSNQNKSTTLNRVESIDLENSGEYSRRTPLNRGRAMFGAIAVGEEVYFSGGLTSGHSPGFVEIVVEPDLQYIEARGTQSGGLFITLKNDAGEIINDDIRVDVRGVLRMPAIDNVLADFLAGRAADRALGGTGAGDAPDLPSIGDDFDFGQLIEAQNTIIDPNSDAFQFNAARRLNEEVALFPILYSSNGFVINAGVGGVTLLPRSEDPLANFQQLSEFISNVLQSTPETSDETFTGDLTQEELAALGDTLSAIKLPPTIIDSGSLRELYTIETKVTILDPILFGQTVSQFDLDVQQRIDSKIIELLTPPEEDPADSGVGFGDFFNSPSGGQSPDGGSAVDDSECFLLQHTAQQDVPDQAQGTRPDETNAPGGVGGFAGSGQCLFCQTVIPTNADVRAQLPAVSSVFYNTVDWMPQIKKRLVDSDHTLEETISALDVIDKEVPFGSSQLYNAMFEASRVTAGDELDAVKKVIYVASDNSQNLSLVTRQEAIDEVNSIDGDRKAPVIYTVFSTSFPISLAAQLERSEVGDVEKITQATGGQSTTLIQSGFLDQILNLSLGSATGGLGYGIYTNKLIFSELSGLTAMTLDFDLPINTQGYIRFKYSTDGFNFTDFSERYEGSQIVDFIDFFAKVVSYEVVLTTGFTTDVAEEYDEVATGMPKLLSIMWETSGEREDFMWIDKEQVPTNTQQVAMAFEGTIPTSGIVEMGVASSNSHNWLDFQSKARPAVREFGKTFMLERTDDPNSLVPIEPLTTLDGKLYVSDYGAWDPAATVSLFEIDEDNQEVPVLTGFTLYPREGEIYFDTKQPPDKRFKLAIVNDDCMRVGVRLRNRIHSDSISIEGVGYIYSTNDDKPVALSQVAPRVINVQISPQTPNAGDTFFALYDFIDLNNNEEQGTIISWFRNGVQLLEIQNSISWTNAELLPSNKLIPGDKISFQVIPSDGIDFGTPVLSPAVTVVAQTPGAEDVRIVPFRNGIVNERFDTSSDFFADYDFQTDDTGVAGIEDGTIIRWFVNGGLYKEDTFSQNDIESDGQVNQDAKFLRSTEISAGIPAHIIGNQIQVEVTPKTIAIQGDAVTSQTITVENSIAILTNVKITPEVPTTQSTLTVTYDIDDNDITNFETQTDQSEVKWYKSTNGTDFVEVTELANSTTATAFFLDAGDQWYAIVTPFDGLDLGAAVRSNTLTISP